MSEHRLDRIVIERPRGPRRRTKVVRRDEHRVESSVHRRRVEPEAEADVGDEQTYDYDAIDAGRSRVSGRRRAIEQGYQKYLTDPR